MKHLRSLSLVVLVGMAHAQAVTPVEALARLARASQVQPGWFTQEFAPLLAQVQSGFSGFRASFGNLRGVEPASMPDTYRLSYDHGSVTVAATLNGDGQFTGLRILAVQGAANRRQVGAALLRLFTGASPQAAQFAPAFLQAVPLEQIRSTLAAAVKGLGRALKVSAVGDGYEVQFERGVLPVPQATLDEQGRFTGLIVRPARPKAASTSAAVATFRSLPGQVSVLVAGPDGEVASLNPQARLAVGSSFKLAVLAELQAQEKAGNLKWTDTATLQSSDKSLPSGTLQNEPAGTKYSLEELARRMISQSDNTATDILLRVVGRENVERRAEQAPLPSTRELFVLKAPANAALLGAYRTGNVAEKRAVLQRAASMPLPDVSVFDGQKVLAPDVEYFMSVTKLCSLMGEVAALPLTALNPGFADPASFARVSYKGGSETGVLNATTRVTTKGGKTYCLSATWNNTSALDTARFASLYESVLDTLR